MSENGLKSGFGRWAALAGRLSLYGLFYGLALFVLVEAGLRFLDMRTLSYYRKLKMLHVYHPTYYVGLAPGVDLHIKHYQDLWEGRFTTNSLGYRGSPEPDSSAPKLLCLGDSIVMGFGVSDHETFCARLNGVELKNGKYQALNLGVDAFGSLGSAQRLGEAVKELKRPRVALFVVSANDFTLPPDLRQMGVQTDDEKETARENDAAYRRRFRWQFEATRWSYALFALKLAYSQSRVKAVAAKDGLIEESRAVRASPSKYLLCGFYRCFCPPGEGDPEPEKRAFARQCVKPAAPTGEPATPRAPRTSAEPDASVAAAPDENFPETFAPIPPLPAGDANELSVKERDRCYGAQTPAERLAPLPPQTERAYDRMIATARAAGTRLVVVLLPIQAPVLDCGVWGKYSPWFDYALRAGNYFKKKGVDVMDLRRHLPRLLQRRPNGARFFHRPTWSIPGDGHFTAPGNAWVAESIREELVRLGL